MGTPKPAHTVPRTPQAPAAQVTGAGPLAAVSGQPGGGTGLIGGGGDVPGMSQQPAFAPLFTQLGQQLQRPGQSLIGPRNAGQGQGGGGIR